MFTLNARYKVTLFGLMNKCCIENVNDQLIVGRWHMYSVHTCILVSDTDDSVPVVAPGTGGHRSPTGGLR